MSNSELRVERMPEKGDEPAPARAPSSAMNESPKRSAGKSGGSRVVKSVLVAAAVLAAVAAGAYGIRAWLGARGHVTTDDAQVEGRIIPVLSRVSGYVAEVGVVDNQAVRQGDLLARIDDRDLKAKLAQSEADVVTAQTAVGSKGHTGQAEAKLSAARAQVAEAQANVERAESDLARYEVLAKQNVISQQQLETQRTAAVNARAQLAGATDLVGAAQSEVHAASSRLESARASRDQAALQLAYARIVSPRDGVVSRKSAEIGQLVQAGQQLFVVVQLSDVWVIGNFKETQMRNVRPGDPVEIRVDTYPGRVFAGEVESVSPATGAKFSLLPPDNATGNFTKVVQRIPVKIRLVQGNDPQTPLRPGMSARVTVKTGTTR
jgi:membrane fusion protein (multidrug efflux system)